MSNQKGNLYLIIAIIVGVVAIGVTGFASWKYFGGGSEMEKNGNEITKPLIEKEKEKSEIVDEKVDLSSKASATEDWKTYRNEEYGFEIKYPKNWNVQNVDPAGNLGAQHAIEFLKQEGDFTYRFEFFIFDNLSDQKWYTKEILDDVKIVMIDNKTSAFKGKTRYDVSPALVSFWTYKSKSYLFKTLPRMAEKRFIDIFEQMLSTFKFIETNETANWKTYKNNEYDYEVKYPKELSPYEINIGSKSEIIFGIERYEGEGPGIWIFVRDNPSQLSIEDFWIDEIKKWGNYKEVKENTLIKDTSVFNVSAVRIKTLEDYTSRPFEDVYIAYNTKMYIIHTNVLNSQKWKNYFNQIISTFKFTD